MVNDEGGEGESREYSISNHAYAQVATAGAARNFQ